jgi:hypothetical protein
MKALDACAAQQAFAAALLDPTLPAPSGLAAWNGSDVAVRLGVYRNNVATSLVDVLADTCPVVAQLVGDEFFTAMARRYVREDPPASPVMTDYGDGFADWMAHFEPVAGLPYLPAMARLERARVRAFHAADAAPAALDRLASALADPLTLPYRRPRLAPSVSVVISDHAVVSLWAAHQHEGRARDAAIGAVDLARPEAALVLRDQDDVLVLSLGPAEARLVAQWQSGAALAAALASVPGADLTTALSLLVRHHAVIELSPAPAPNACIGDP